MGICTINRWTCNICREEQETESETILPGWIKFYISHDAPATCICPKCCKQISELSGYTKKTK